MKKTLLFTLTTLVLMALSSCCKHEMAVTQDKLLPSCTETGYTGDLYCPECDKIITEGESIPAAGHIGERVGVKETSCAEEGYTGDICCASCGITLETGESIEKLPHTEELRNQKDPTCAEEGYTGDTWCSVCGKKLESGTDIEKLPHTEKRINETEPTCTNPGDTGDVVCTVCNETLEYGKWINQLPHNWTAVNAIPSTCIKQGYEGDLTCRDCGKEQMGSRLPVTDHSFTDGVCTICGWLLPGLYVDDELILTWEELKEYNYVYVSNGQLKSTQGNFQGGKLVIGEDVTYIDGNYSTGLKNANASEVWFPRSITELGNYLFYDIFGNHVLTDVVMYCQITELMKSTFYNCAALERIVLPDSIRWIGADAFDGCTSLKYVDWPESLEYIGREAFWSCQLTSIDLPEGVTEISQYAFAQNPIQTIKLPSTLRTLEFRTFYECKQLQSVDMSACENLTYLESAMFIDCVNLREVKLPPNLTGMDSGIFRGCTSLRRLSLPDGFTSINLNPYYATFGDCSINEIVIPKSLITIGDLNGCPITSIKYRGSEAQWKMTTGYGNFPNATIEYNYTGE